MAKIIGRKKEIEELQRISNREEAQFVAVFGRRRIGKTFLIREVFKDKFAFYHTGISPLELEGKNLIEKQLSAFNSTLARYGQEALESPKDWFEAFDRLIDLLSAKKTEEKLIVFIDEMPWLDTPRSCFISAFEHFWNGWGASQDNLMLIVCGSASSWIQNNLINSHGGLYNRVTCEIQLQPFTLYEAEQLLKNNGINYSQYSIAEAYMAVGGVPFYLNYLNPSMSVAQNIDSLFFAPKAKLKEEFNRLFQSIFSKPEQYEKIIRLLAENHSGYTRQYISEKIGVEGKSLTQYLRALEMSDFIQKYIPFGNSKREVLYRLSDPFCIFYLKFVDGQNNGTNFWQINQNKSPLNSWRGIAFEELCMLHIPQIKQALGVSGVVSNNTPWTLRGDKENTGAQIDLIIDRQDRIVSICEMKFVISEFSITKEYEAKLRRRLQLVTDRINNRIQNAQLVIITTFGLENGMYNSLISNVVTLEDLFK